MIKDWTFGLLGARIATHCESEIWINATTMPINKIGNSTASGADQTEPLVVTDHIGSNTIFVFVSE
jgi:hypothetical protein